MTPSGAATGGRPPRWAAGPVATCFPLPTGRRALTDSSALAPSRCCAPPERTRGRSRSTTGVFRPGGWPRRLSFEPGGELAETVPPSPHHTSRCAGPRSMVLVPNPIRVFSTRRPGDDHRPGPPGTSPFDPRSGRLPPPARSGRSGRPPSIGPSRSATVGTSKFNEELPLRESGWDCRRGRGESRRPNVAAWYSSSPGLECMLLVAGLRGGRGRRTACRPPCTQCLSSRIRRHMSTSLKATARLSASRPPTSSKTDRLIMGVHAKVTRSSCG